LVEGDVVRAFEPDDVVALELVARIAAGVGFLVQRDSELAQRLAQGLEVTNLRLDGCEVTHGFLLSLVQIWILHRPS
jgi:hypothetical protein